MISSENYLRKTIFMEKNKKINKSPQRKLCKIVNRRSNLSLNDVIRIGDTETVKQLIRGGVNVNEREKSTWTPLHVAANYGRFNIIKFLIHEGAKVNSAVVGLRGCEITPLYLAVLKNHLNCVQLLLENGASVSSKKEFCHPIHIAVFNGYVEMATLLLDHGADVDLRFNNKFFEGFKNTMLSDLWRGHNLPLLHCSILRKFKKMTQLLMDHGADTNLNTSLGKTTLMQAVEVNDAELVDLLVFEMDANVNDRDDFGQPVLHFLMVNANRKASMYSKEEFGFNKEKCQILDHLLHAGVDINAHFPENEDRSAVVHYMIKYGFGVGVIHMMNQCDFNSKEIDLETAQSAQLFPRLLTPEIKKDRRYLVKLLEEFNNISFILARWTIFRHMIELPINKQLLESTINGHDGFKMENHTEAINTMKNEAMEEINYMKLTKVPSSSSTYWRLLTCDMNELAKLMANKNVRYLDSVNNNRELKLGNYGLMLISRIYVGKKRSQLLKQSIEVISKLFVNMISFDCCERILEILSDKELEVISFCN